MTYLADPSVPYAGDGLSSMQIGDDAQLCRKFIFGEESHICIVILILCYSTILLMLLIIPQQGVRPLHSTSKWTFAWSTGDSTAHYQHSQPFSYQTKNFLNIIPDKRNFPISCYPTICFSNCFPWFLSILDKKLSNVTRREDKYQLLGKLC